MPVSQKSAVKVARPVAVGTVGNKQTTVKPQQPSLDATHQELHVILTSPFFNKQTQIPMLTEVTSFFISSTYCILRTQISAGVSLARSTIAQFLHL